MTITKNSIDYAITCIHYKNYDGILVDIHKFIDTQLKNSIKNIYDKYDLSNYKNMIESTVYEKYNQELDNINPKDSLQKAMINFVKNDNKDETINLFNDVIQESPKDNRIARLFLAVTYARYNELETAIQTLENNNENDTHMFVYLYIMKNNLNKIEDEDWDKHLNTGTTFADYLNNAILLRLVKKYDRALENLKNIKDMNLDKEKAGLFFTTLGIIYFQLKNYQLAIEFFDKTLKADENHFEAKRSQAICFALLNGKSDKEKAISIFTALAKEKPLDNDIHRNLAVSYANKYPTYKHLGDYNDDYKNIINYFNLTIQNNPFHSPSYFDRGTFYFDQKDFENAQKDFSKSIEYADYKLKYYRKYVESFLKNYDYTDLSILNSKLDKGLSKSHTVYTIIDYLYLIKIKSKCLVHTYLDSKKCDLIMCKLERFITCIDDIFIEYKYKLSKKIKGKMYEITSLLYNYIEDLNTIKNNDKYILKVEDLTTVKLKTADKSLFRGMNRTSWDLKPNIFREDNKDDKSTMLENFKREAVGVSNDNYDHYKSVDWFGLMQHHGALTALLDWTQSFSIGLFFAMHLDNKQDLNPYGVPCVYVLEYKNILTIQDVEDVIEVDYGINNDSKNNTLQHNDDDILLFAPRISHKRADIQKSMFTYHRSNVDFNSDRGTNKDFLLKKYIISPLLIDLFTKILEKDHINIATVYPDLQNLSKRLRNKENINNLEFSNT